MASFTLFETDGRAVYVPQWIDNQKSLDLFEYLTFQIEWMNDEVVLFGKKHILRRKVAWVADQGLTYKYAGHTKTPQPWLPELMQLKNQLEFFTKSSFNACLINYYHDGIDAMGWHADNEPEIVPNSTIASISLGASRKFKFKHRQLPLTKDITLENGSLLLMEGTIQKHWLHALPKSKKISDPRINLTFRNCF